jgi:ssDNA-binding Zn-finger/Zn-ribbon topoisomerase 1
MGTSIRRNVYYCPKCDKTIPKDRVEKIDMELRERFGVEKLSRLRCPVCDAEYIDLDKVVKGGEKNVGKVAK